jgi:hypothetical protein
MPSKDSSHHKQPQLEAQPLTQQPMAIVSRVIMGVTSSSSSSSSHRRLQGMLTRLVPTASNRVILSRAIPSKVIMDMVMHSLLSSRVISKATASRDFLMGNLKQDMLPHSQLRVPHQQLQVGMIILQQLLLLLPLLQLQ